MGAGNYARWWPAGARPPQGPAVIRLFELLLLPTKEGPAPGAKLGSPESVQLNPYLRTLADLQDPSDTKNMHDPSNTRNIHDPSDTKNMHDPSDGEARTTLVQSMSLGDSDDDDGDETFCPSELGNHYLSSWDALRLDLFDLNLAFARLHEALEDVAASEDVPHPSFDADADMIDIEVNYGDSDRNEDDFQRAAAALLRFGHAYAYTYNLIDDLDTAELANLNVWTSSAIFGLDIMDLDLIHKLLGLLGIANFIPPILAQPANIVQSDIWNLLIDSDQTPMGYFDDTVAMETSADMLGDRLHGTEKEKEGTNTKKQKEAMTW